MSLLIVGSIALDTVSTPFGRREDILGGSTVYTSMASKNFCQTNIVGVVGEDFPKEHIELLKSNDIDTEGMEIIPGKTFRWKGVYNDLNRAETLDTQLNVFAEFNPRIPENYKKCDYVFLGNIDPVLQLRVLDQMQDPKVTACDTMNFWISGNKDALLNVIKKVDILFINEDEIKMLIDESNIYQAAEIALSFGPKIVVIKCGEHGSVCIGENFIFFAPVYPVKKAMDPTGAGDSFAGGFMGYLARKDNFDKDTIRNAMIYGTIMASFCVESFSLEKVKELTSEMIEIRKEEIRESVMF